MNIGMTSDLHIDINKEYPVAKELIKLARETLLDVLLIAGDISESAELTLNTLDRISEEAGCKVYFVPGNHDMWDKSGNKAQEPKTNEVYERYRRSPYCIAEKTVLLNDDWVLFGNIGWYDYSFGDGFSAEEYDIMSHNGRTWQDRMYSVWSRDNRRTHQWQLDTLQKAVAPYRSMHKILMTHMVSHPVFTVPKNWSDKIDWAYFNAFLGSRDYQAFCKNAAVDYALMGHVHYRGEYKEGTTTYVCSCLNYYNEWKSDNFSKELALALRVITV